MYKKLPFELIDLDSPKTEKEWDIKREQLVEQYKNKSISVEEKITKLAATCCELIYYFHQNGSLIKHLLKELKSANKTIELLSKMTEVQNKLIKLGCVERKKLEKRLEDVEKQHKTSV